MLLDHSRPTVFPVKVLAKSVSSGRNTTYDLNLPPWGPIEAGDASVPRAFYDKVAVGETVCVDLYRGALGMRWYEIAHCRS